MKVLLVLSGNSKDGINIIVKNQAETLKRSDLLIEYFRIDGKGFLSYFKHILLLRRHLLRQKYDLFHAHYSFSGIVATIAGCKPLVVSLMGSDTQKNFLWKSIIRFFSKMFWDITIVKSISMKQDSGIKKVVVLPNGVDLESVKPLTRRCFSENRVVLFASDPERKSKNFELARKAMDLMQDDKISLKVIHSISHKEILQEINHADLLIVTSLWEGSPNIVKEAMACNCPVVSTKVGDVEWLFGDQPGYFLTSSDPADVADKIKEALEFSKVYGKTNGRDRIIELGLDSRTIALKLINLYKEILEKRI
ncbi:MAG TPA: glycosyltransferase family 4 protein [Bacteroidales bacterium]|nr:glycosyltransferase family 4 protein [Bacteroidales bacterium]